MGAAPSRLFTYTANTTISSSQVTANEDALFNYLQAGVDTYSPLSILNADISASAGIDDAKLDLSAVAQAVAFNGTVSIVGALTVTGNSTFAGTTIANLGTVTTADINGGTIDGTIIGGASAAAVTTTSLVATTADINGGTLDGVQIAGATATGSIFYNDASDDVAALAPGAAGTYLGGNGTTSIPSWKIPSGIQSGQDLAEQSATSGAFPSYTTIYTPSLVATTPNIQFFKNSSVTTLYVSWDGKYNANYSNYQGVYAGGSIGGTEKDITTSYATYTDSIDISGLTDNAWYSFIVQGRASGGTNTHYVKNVKFAVY